MGAGREATLPARKKNGRDRDQPSSGRFI
ncbi:hypothetical protein BpHYR1_043235 [Brachionus plicatilis]|uniref:Uncharacterized protein n=1 Tax=Brachionus plicatilis TaxID=10195 RepID=A0A3M7QBT6_BRAPC|nr:hypothetical protein BpHYR1_043235 [Brachionus plicatilis]